MMRALWTAGSGMIAQQHNVDVISNNLANVNTTGYKKDRTEFKDMLYETIERAYTAGNEGRPANFQVGHGTRVFATVKDFSTGSFETSDNPLDLAIDGDGFFTVLGPNGEVAFTRDGSFKLSVTEEGNMLTTSDGYPVLDDAGSQIYLNDIDISSLKISSFGEISYEDETGTNVPLGQTLGIVKFANRNGLESIGSNLYRYTSASGYPIADYETGERSIIKQYSIERSNVQVVEEMVNLIVAQRAYEINSKAIQTADDMLSLANNLKR